MDALYPEFNTKVFIDSNVVLECLPLDTLPWADIDPVGPILILLTPKVRAEIDSKKRDGRLGKRARDFNRLLAPMATHGGPVVLLEGPPRICIAAAVCGRIDWGHYDDMDPDDADARVVAEVLHAKGIPTGQGQLISQDINPLLIAQRHGIKTIHVPESWLPPPEPSAKDREIARLKARLAEYEKAEPSLEVAFETSPTPVAIYKVQELAPHDAATLLADILQKNPMLGQDRGPLSALSYDHGLEARYRKYETEEVPGFVKRLHKSLEVLHGQVPFALTVKNVGDIRADNVIVEVSVVGGWINAKPIVLMKRGPLPPRIEPFDPLRGMRFDHLNVPHIGKHEFKVDAGPRCESVSAQCEDFRHGQSWVFAGVVWLDPDYAQDTVVNINVTAANLRGAVARHYALSKTVHNAYASDLVDLKTGDWKVLPHIQPLIDEALKSRNAELIEFDGGMARKSR